MRPALSVIFFTVASGMGLGLVTLVVLADLFAYAGGLSRRAVGAGLGIGYALISAGLVSSTFHLANPRNAWRAFSQFRRSWLSREAVLAVALYPTGLAYAGAKLGGAPLAVCAALGLAVVVLALATLASTAMIYACLKTVPRWHDRLVPASYLALGLYSGSVAMVALAAWDRAPLAPYAAVSFLLLAVAAGVKAAYFRRFAAPRSPYTLAGALGFPGQSARLLDVGHTHGNFLTHEFGFRIARERATALRYAFATLAFLVPILVIGLQARHWAALGAAAIVCAAGILVERWLFFAEAEHVVRLFHGQQRL